ncbi:MAG: hypothetical protein CMH22_16035 [Methylophaga sp.]|nr:hypothetical protein [Methylophaga sp.]MAX53486.1 hypothetical protein [Methylophaga sp.]|tara:strand:+ start:19692 stop:19964 length:273 start_codon:yes stop_codon:yes gene_type:complete
MLIEITRRGVYRGTGEMVPVGTQVEVPDDFTGWANKYRVVSSGADKTLEVATPKRPRKKRQPKQEQEPEQSRLDTKSEFDGNDARGGDYE